MKEHNYTFELTEALRENGGECFLCTIEKRLEEQVLSYYLGPALMEPDCRMETNKKGFCGRHLSKLSHGGNQLGLSLMLDTHLEEVRRKLFQSLGEKEGAKPKAQKRREKKNANGDAEIFSFNHSCAVCDKLESYRRQVMDNFLYIYKKEKEFKDLFLASKGMCLVHMEALVTLAKETMKGKEYEAFLQDVLSVEHKALSSLQEEIHWYTQKFDYRNDDAPWGTAKDAPERTMKRLGGEVVV